MAAGPQLPLAAVLAGGRGIRMGGAKATAPLAGRPLLAHPLGALKRAGLEAVVVAKPATPLPPVGAPVWWEAPEPIHPLAGIVHALREAAGRPLLVVAGDMPLVPPPLLRWLAELRVGLAVPEVEGRPQPLLARYGAEHAAPLERALRDGTAAGVAVRALGPRVVREDELRRFGDPLRMLLNVNSREDLIAAERLIAGADSS